MFMLLHFLGMRVLKTAFTFLNSLVSVASPLQDAGLECIYLDNNDQLKDFGCIIAPLI